MAVTVPVIVEPVRLSKLVVGKTAWYVACGRPDWTVALPPGPRQWKVSTCDVPSGAPRIHTSETDNWVAVVGDSAFLGLNATEWCGEHREDTAHGCCQSTGRWWRTLSAGQRKTADGGDGVFGKHCEV